MTGLRHSLHYAKNAASHLPDPGSPWGKLVMAPDPRAAAVSDLHRAIAALSPHLRDPEDLAQLGHLRAAADRLSAPAHPVVAGLRDFDPARFQRLLDFAGPEMAGALLTHLLEDLVNCRSATCAGTEGPDWDTLQRGSHNLISLAGSAGAISLQTLAEALNAVAQAQDLPAARGLTPGLLAELDALIAIVRTTPAPPISSMGGAS